MMDNGEGAELEGEVRGIQIESVGADEASGPPCPEQTPCTKDQVSWVEQSRCARRC